MGHPKTLFFSSVMPFDVHLGFLSNALKWQELANFFESKNKTEMAAALPGMSHVTIRQHGKVHHFSGYSLLRLLLLPSYDPTQLTSQQQ